MKQLDLLEPPPSMASGISDYHIGNSGFRAGQLHSFHVRSHVAPLEALAGERRAASQEADVLAWMRAHPGRWTPWDLAEALGLCINSVRRSMTNLAHANPARLRHIPGERRVAGPWGQRSGVWEAA